MYQVHYKLSTLNYRVLIDVGIVHLDGQLPHRTSNKQHHHGDSVWCYSSMAMAKKPTQPPGASLEGVGQGRCGWVLFINADRLRNKLITKIYNFILIFFSSHFYLPQSNGIARPPCSPPVTHPPYTPLYCRRLLLVGWYVLSSRWRPSKAMTWFIPIFCFSNCHPKRWDGVPHTPHPGLASLPKYLPPLKPTHSLLLRCLMKLRSPKAMAPAMSLFICVWSFWVQNKGIDCVPPNHLARA